MYRTVGILAIALTVGPIFGEPPGPNPGKPPRPPFPWSCAFSPDGKYALIGYSYGGDDDKPLLRLFEVESGEEVRSYPGHKREVDCLAFTADGKQAVANTVVGGEVFFMVWEVKTGDKVRTIRGKRNEEFRVGGVSRDGKRLLTWAMIDVGEGGTNWNGRAKLQLWDVATGDLVKTFDGSKMSVRAIQVSEDGKLALLRCQPTRDLDNSVLKVVDLSEGKIIHSFEIEKDPVSGVGDFSRDGKSLLLNSGNGAEPENKARLILWDVAKEKEARKFAKREGGGDEPLTRQPGLARHAQFSADGKTLLTCDDDGMFRMWDTATGKLAWSINRTGWASFSSDDKQVICLISQPDVAEQYSWHFEVRDARTGKRLSKKEAKLEP
jgi:WD40 repeat protein